MFDRIFRKGTSMALIDPALAGNQKSANIIAGVNQFVDKNVPADFRKWSQKIEALRAELKETDRPLTGIRPAGGSYIPGQVVEMVNSEANLSYVVKASKRPIWCRLLFTLITEVKPMSALELGTCVGVSTSYQAAAQARYGGNLITMEGASDYADVARENLTRLGLEKNVTIVKGLFSDTLDDVLDSVDELDFVFIDGHHDGDATIEYYHKIKPKLTPEAIILFDDIRWSKDMERAWNELREDDSLNLVVDMEEVGICARIASDEVIQTSITMDELKS